MAEAYECDLCTHRGEDVVQVENEYGDLDWLCPFCRGTQGRLSEVADERFFESLAPGCYTRNKAERTEQFTNRRR